MLSMKVSARSVRIYNDWPHYDVNNNIMDAHDSKLFYHAPAGLFYWYAASYGSCAEPSGSNGCANTTVGSCGFRTDHTVTLFTSRELLQWTNQGVVFHIANSGLPTNSVLFAPKTIYHAAQNQFVLWFNYIVGSFSNSYYAVATSPTATGPFKLVNMRVSTLQFDDVGDFNLFIDNDGRGYVIYTSISHNHAISIEQLTDDFTETLGASASSGFFGAANSEAPMMFRRGSIYYAVFGSTCCYCEGGSVVTVYTATSPLGPYTNRSNLGDLHSQSTDCFVYKDDNNATQVMYIGDHWQSSPDGEKGHDFTVWSPLTFSDDGLTVTTKGYQYDFTVSVNTATDTNNEDQVEVADE